MSDQDGSPAVPNIRIRTRVRQDQVITQRPEPIPDAVTPPAADPLDAEIDAALREGRPVDTARAFPTRERRAIQVEPYTAPPPPPPDAYSHLPDVVPAALPEDPSQRAAVMQAMGDIMGKEEFQLRMLHRMMQRQFPLASIATAMGISLRSVYRLRAKLRDRYREEATDIDIVSLAGKSIWFHEELVSSALRISQDTTHGVRERLLAMRMADNFRTSFYRFMNLAGFFQDSPYAPSRMATEAREAAKGDSTLRVLSDILKLAMDDPLNGEDATLAADMDLLGETSEAKALRDAAKD